MNLALDYGVFPKESTSLISSHPQSFLIQYSWAQYYATPAYFGFKVHSKKENTNLYTTHNKC